MECVFLVLQTGSNLDEKVYEEQHFSPFFNLKLQELKIFLDSLFSTKTNQLSSLSFFFLHI